MNFNSEKKTTHGRSVLELLRVWIKLIYVAE